MSSDEHARSLYAGVSRLLVCGSRTFPRSQMALIEAELRWVGRDTVIVHGGNGYFDRQGRCIAGADMLADEIWRRSGGKTEVFRAKWALFGPSAGPLRNRAMLKSGVELVLAFWDGVSRGTAGTLRMARERGIPARVVGF